MDISKISSERIQERQAQEAAQSQKSQSANQSRESAHVGGAEGSSPAQKAENVKWSAGAKLASEALATAKASPDVRADRVASLKAAIADGTYKMDSKAIADKMISHSLENDLLTRNG